MGYIQSFATIRRLQKALNKAESKLELSEALRERERASHYKLVLNLLDRWHTSEKKTHAVSQGVLEALAPEIVTSKPDPFAGWTDEEREFDERCFREAGHPNPEKAAADAYIQNYVNTRQQ